VRLAAGQGIRLDRARRRPGQMELSTAEHDLRFTRGAHRGSKGERRLHP
jgi:hypothetical protein